MDLSSFLYVQVGPYHLAFDTESVLKIVPSEEGPSILWEGREIHAQDLLSIFNIETPQNTHFNILIKCGESEFKVFSATDVGHFRRSSLVTPVAIPPAGLLHPEVFSHAIRDQDKVLIVTNLNALAKIGCASDLTQSRKGV
ncbi:hypothetical protein KAI87_05205 [Myxococcota bacterium]|nr:hypothetical protein [Myxococcota bacterium]